MADEKELSSEELFRGAVAPPEQPPAEPAPEAITEAPVAEAPVEAPAAEPPEAGVPSWRLREEAEARRAAEQRAQALETHLRQIQAQIQSSQKQPDFFENPDQATQQLILRTLQPYAEAQNRAMMEMGKMVARAVHGVDAVDEAEQAFLRAREEGTLDTMDYERVVQSPNRYDAAVQWYRRQSVLSSVGDDPNAWFEKQLEAKMADPKFQAALLEKVRGSAAKAPSAVKLPPSLSKSTAVAGNSGDPAGDMSDASLFAYAMKR